MSPRLLALGVILAVFGIVGCLVYSLALLFVHSPAWGIVGCVVLVGAMAGTHKAMEP